MKWETFYQGKLNEAIVLKNPPIARKMRVVLNTKLEYWFDELSKLAKELQSEDFGTTDPAHAIKDFDKRGLDEIRQMVERLKSDTKELEFKLQHVEKGIPSADFAHPEDMDDWEREDRKMNFTGY